MTGELHDEFFCHTFIVNSLVFSSDNSLLASGVAD